MSDSIQDEENNYNDEIAESISKSCESNSKKRSNTILGSRKKIRRSRIIISDTNEMINESKKEIYDSETKLKKSIYSAVCFNENLNANRKEISKDFLKRKLKAAFEREPIDKNKGFFNVPFIPMPSMFSTLPSTASLPSIPPQQSNRQVNVSNTGQTCVQNISKQSTSINANAGSNPNYNTTTSNTSKQDQSVVLNLNKLKEDAGYNSNQPTISINRNPSSSSVNNYDNVPKAFPSNQNNNVMHAASQSKSINQNLNNPSQIKLPSQNSRHLFNVNQSNVSLNSGENSKNDMTKQYMMNTGGNTAHSSTNNFNISLSEEKEIKYQINASNSNNAIKNINIDTEVKNANEPGKMLMQQSALNLFNLTPEEIKRLKPEQIEQLNRAIRQKAQMQKQNIANNNNNNLNPNKNSHLGELIRQQQNSIYVQIIESYKNDPEKFRSEATTNELIKLQKLMSMSRMQSDNNSNNINQNAVSNIAPKEGINNSYQFNLQLLQGIQKQIQRARELNQNTAVINTGNTHNNNLNTQISKPN